MAHTDHRTLRRVLRREIAGTIGLLTDEHDFRAMRRYRSFAFEDHPTYLRHVEAVLRTRALQGGHTTLALFDPVEYADYCARGGLDPDSHTSRTRFTAELAATGPTVPYGGEPLSALVPALVDEGVRQATWEYAASLLARLGPCTTCGEDLGRAAHARASHLLTRILDTAPPGHRPPRAHAAPPPARLAPPPPGAEDLARAAPARASHLLTRILDTAPPGHRHLVCSVSGPAETLLAVLHADDHDGRPDLDEAEA